MAYHLAERGIAIMDRVVCGINACIVDNFDFSITKS